MVRPNKTWNIDHCITPLKCRVFVTLRATKSFTFYIQWPPAYLMASLQPLYVCITSAKKSQTSISAVTEQINMEIGVLHFGMRDQAFKWRHPLPFIPSFLSLSLFYPLRPAALFLQTRWAFRPWHCPNEWAGWFIAEGEGNEGRDGGTEGRREVEGGMESVRGVGSHCRRSAT